MTVTDPKTVREIARTAGLMIVESVARDHIVHAAMAQHGIGHDNVYAWSETYDRVLDELAAVLKPLTQPDEQQPADVVTAERQQDEAVGRVEAMAECIEESVRDGNRVMEIAAEDAELLRAVLAERTALAAQTAELESEREADTRVVAAWLDTSTGNQVKKFKAIEARFADRIEALDAADTEES